MAREQPPHIALLGPIEVHDAAGHPIAIDGTQRRAVLAQLALEPGRAVSVSALSEGLWGEHPPATATKSIQVHVSRLRQALPADTIATRAPGYLLDLHPSATDVGQFRASSERARATLREGAVEEASVALRQALDLWRGTALADLRSYPFAERAAVALEEERWSTHQDRLWADLELGRHEEVVGELEALVAERPLQERCWGLLMVALYRCGRQADALAAYRRARTHLLEEVGLDPGEDLQRLEAQILAHELPGPSALPAPARPPAPTPARTTTSEQEAPSARTEPPTGRSSPTDPTVALALRPPSLLVGRHRATALLADAAEQLALGRGSAVSIRGEEGLGKSALIASFARSVGEQALVVHGRCREHVAVPYGPWSQIARQLDDPTARHLLEGGGDDESPERRRIRLFEVVTSALRVAAFDRPHVVVLDDLHWSDDASIGLLLHALDELAEDPIAFVLAWRDREIVASHPVKRLEHHLARNEAKAIDLTPLQVDDLVQLIGHVAPDTPPEQRGTLAQQVQELTGGVPLFATEVIATLAAHPPVDPSALRAPETVRTLVAGRLSAVAGLAQQVAEACAVLAEPLTIDLVAPLAPDAAPATLLDALDQLVDIGLLQEIDGGYAFVHAAFRHSIVASMRSGRRQRLHAEVYRVLGAVPVPPAVLVHHGESAGPLVGGADIGRHLRAAGDDAMQRGAFADAQGFYGRVVDRAAPHELAATYVAYADALGRSGDVSGMKHAATRALREAQVHGASGGTVAEAVALLCSFGDGFGIDRDAIATVEAARQTIDDPATRTRLDALIAYHHAMWGSNVETSRTALDAALDSCPDPCPADLRGAISFAEGLTLLGDPDLERRFAVADELIALAEVDPSTAHHGRGVRLRCLALLTAGRFAELDETLADLRAVAEAEGSWLYLADTWRWRIAATIASGDDEAAELAIAELEDIGTGPLSGRAFVGTQRMILDWFTGRTEACLAYIEGMRAVLPTDDPPGTDRRLVDLIALAALVEADRHDEARAIYAPMAPHRDLDRSSCRRATAELALCAQVAAELGDLEPAADLHDRLRPFAGQLVVVSWGECTIGSADGYLAQLRTLLDGQVDDDGFARAVAIETELGDHRSAERTARRWERATERSAVVELA